MVTVAVQTTGVEAPAILAVLAARKRMDLAASHGLGAPRNLWFLELIPTPPAPSQTTLSTRQKLATNTTSPAV